MTTAYTTLLGLALPVQGELSGTWGDMVDNAITSPLDVAVAGTQTISGSQTAVTLSVTNGNSSATNLAQVGSGATGSAQYAIINCTGNPASLLTITAPASSREYTILNATSTSQSVKIVGSGPTTGVTIVSGEKAVVTWNGSDYVKVATSTAGSGSVTAVTGSGNIASSGGTAPNITFTGTLPVANGGTGSTTLTANNVLLGNGTSALQVVAPGTAGNVLTSNGTTWTSSAGASVSAATPTALGTVYGRVSTANTNYSIGQYSLNSGSLTGTDNIAMGQSALFSNTSGYGNLALGSTALYTNTTGVSNTATGYAALQSNTTASNNTAVGSAALYSNTTSGNNTAVGYNALNANTTGTSNTAVGSVALQNNTTGSNNSAFGWYSLILNSTGGSNTASGVFSMYANTTGSSNTAYGYQSLYTNTVNGNNTAVGRGALQNSDAADNTALGHSAGLSVTSGQQNTLIGRAAGNSGTNNLTTGSNNILIGYNSTASSATVSNEITFGDGSITAFRIPGLSISWAATDVPFRNIPQNAQTGSYTLVLADSGKHIYHASGAGAATYTIPANGSVAYPIGTAITFINLSATAISIAITTDTMYLSSAGTTGTRTLAQYGSATAIKVDSTTWVISGSALT